MIARSGSHSLRRGEYPVRRGTVADVLSPEEIRQMIREEARQGVILLNFSHPFTQEHIRQLEECVGRFVEFVCPDGRVDFDPESDFETQVRDLVDSLGFCPRNGRNRVAS